MRAKIQKWGNGLGLRIPKVLAEEAGVAAGSEVDLAIENGWLVLKAARRRKYRLQELVRRITPKNLHDGVDSGPPAGGEIW